MSVIACPSIGAWPTAHAFLCERFAHISPQQWHARFDAGEIADATCGAVLTRAAPFIAGQRIAYERSIADEPRIPFEAQIVFQDEWLVIADKPHFLPVVPSGRYVRETLLHRLRTQLQMPALTPIHRIDQDTAGIVAFCIKPETRGAYQTLFAKREVIKIYEAIAPHAALNIPAAQFPLTLRTRLQRSAQFMQAQTVEGEANTETLIEMIETHGERTRFQLTPHTGARHQLRAHMASIGAPICNDRIYPSLLPQLAVEDFARTPPLQLRAKSLAFFDPVALVERRFQSAQRLKFELSF
jgi:tRNA pseudouridine32 synthase / 23S rRNA pseudouridine746 synthase